MKILNRVFFLVVVLVFIIAQLSFAAGQKEETGKKFLLYSALLEYPQSRLLAAFEEETGIKGEYIRMSTGELLARVLAEKKTPRGDIIIGVSSESIDMIQEEGVVLPYLSPAREGIQSKFYNDEGYWYGFAMGALAIGVNTKRWESKYGEKPYPKTWEDLLDPAFEGEVIVASPLHSGTAYTFTATILQGMGEEKGWEYIRELDKNVAHYTTSGAAPARSVAAGEFTLAITFGYDQVQIARGGYPLKIIYPPKTGPEIMAMAIIKDGPNTETAKKFIDWMLGTNAQQLYTDLTSQGPVRPGILLPADATSVEKLDLVDYNLKWAAENKERIIKEWAKQVQ